MNDNMEVPRGYVTDRLPRSGAKVEVLCDHKGKTVPLTFLCAWSEDGWIIAGTQRRVDFTVICWREVVLEGRRR